MDSTKAAAEQVLQGRSRSQSPGTDNERRMGLEGLLQSDL